MAILILDKGYKDSELLKKHELLFKSLGIEVIKIDRDLEASLERFIKTVEIRKNFVRQISRTGGMKLSEIREASSKLLRFGSKKKKD